MSNLKNKTILDDNIMFDGKYYRYVNHFDSLLTIGFKLKTGLIKNKNIIRFDENTITKMRNRYNKFYNT